MNTKRSETRPRKEKARKQGEGAIKATHEAFRPFVQDYYDLRDRLEAEGFRISVDPDIFPTICPIQLEGRLPSGERFYFRCRHTSCRLSIAPSKADPLESPTWEQEVERWEWPLAGSLEAEEAEAVLRELVALYEGSKIRR